MITPSAEFVAVGLATSLEAPNDPEDTCLFAMTKQNMAVISLCLWVGQRLFPEVRPAALEIVARIGELSDAQGFLDFDEV